MTAQSTSSSRYDYTRDDDRRLVTVAARQRLDAGDLIAIVNRQIDERTWAYGILYDYRQVWEAPTPQDAAIVSAYVHQQIRLLGPRGPVAFVMSSGPIVEAVTAYAQSATGFAVQVFWERQAASRWLDVQQIAELAESDEHDKGSRQP